MTTTSTAWTEETLEAAGAKLQLVKGGTGDPLLILHGELGYPGWLRYHTALAQDYTLHIPLHPGFGRTERMEWVMNMRDMAIWYLDALDDLGLGPVPVIGCGLGAWLAAEMATSCPHAFKQIVLVNPMGVKPPTGEIFDMFLVVAKEYLEACFFDASSSPEYQELYGVEPTPEEAEAREVAREESSRLGWRPYMHDLSLPPRLRRLRHTPTLIVWGRENGIVPLSAGEQYQASIPGSRLAVLDQCGHHPEIEQADAFVDLVREFLRA